MYDTPLGSNPPNTFRLSCNQITFKIRFVGTEVPVPIATNCVPPYQAGKCACGTSLFTNQIWSDLITPTERFEPGGVLDIAILAQSSARPPKCMKKEVDSVNHSEVIMIQTQRIFITFYTVMYYIIIICDGSFSWKLSHIHVHVHACTYTYGAEKTW